MNQLERQKSAKEKIHFNTLHTSYYVTHILLKATKLKKKIIKEPSLLKP